MTQQTASETEVRQPGRIRRGLTRPVTVYATLLGAPGAMRFVAAGFVSRLTTSMVGLGLVLALTAHHGQYGRAGTVVGLLLLANAVANPILGRLVDQRGQDRVLTPVALTFGAVMAVIIAVVAWHAQSWLLFPLAFLAGASMPVVSPLVRARWAKLHGSDGRLHVAYAFEGATTEFVYIIGPLLVTALAIGAGPMIALGTVLGCAVVGTLALAVQRATQPEPAVSDEPLRPWSLGALRVPSLRVLCVVYFCIGCVYGCVDIVTVAFATAHGHRGLTGVMLGCWGVGAMVAGLAYGALSLETPLPRRVLLGAVGLVATLIPLAFAQNPVWATVLLVVAGCGMSPVAISAQQLLQRAVPGSLLTESISWVVSTMAIGMTVATIVAGVAVDHVHAARLYVLPAVFGALVLGTIAAGYRLLRDSQLEGTT